MGLIAWGFLMARLWTLCHSPLSGQKAPQRNHTKVFCISSGVTPLVPLATAQPHLACGDQSLMQAPLVAAGPERERESTEFLKRCLLYCPSAVHLPCWPGFWKKKKKNRNTRQQGLQRPFFLLLSLSLSLSLRTSQEWVGVSPSLSYSTSFCSFLWLPFKHRNLKKWKCCSSKLFIKAEKTVIKTRKISPFLTKMMKNWIKTAFKDAKIFYKGLVIWE